MKRLIVLSLLLSGAFFSAANAADPVHELSEVPAPPVAASVGEKGIWGAIAYSTADAKHGIFWGGTDRAEAETTALRYCENKQGTECRVVETYRNHRQWNDDDGQFPYNQCAALAVSPTGTAYGTASAISLSEARSAALSKCGDGSCKVVEQGCT